MEETEDKQTKRTRFKIQEEGRAERVEKTDCRIWKEVERRNKNTKMESDRVNAKETDSGRGRKPEEVSMFFRVLETSAADLSMTNSNPSALISFTVSSFLILPPSLSLSRPATLEAPNPNPNCAQFGTLTLKVSYIYSDIDICTVHVRTCVQIRTRTFAHTYRNTHVHYVQKDRV